MTSSKNQALTDEELRTLEGILAKLSGRGADLPWPLFRFMTEVMATVNVDLLVQDEQKGVLLAWRNDPFGAGWHVPGSIIRHREEIAHRVSACAREEFGCEVDAAERPVALLQIFDDRGHSVSLCYQATLKGSPSKRVLGGHETPEAGDLCWLRRRLPSSIPATLLIVMCWMRWTMAGWARASVCLPSTSAAVTWPKRRRTALIGSDAPLT